MKRKIYNFLLSLVIALNVVTPIKLSAEEITEKVFLYDDYTVEYSVKNSWIDSQNINITITNIGEKPINGWALGIDAGGEINSLWNGSVYKCTNSEYIIKNLDYNYEIKPNTSITFGYTLTGKQLSIPTKIEMFSKRVESTGGYKVELIETNNWDTGFQGEITICNLTSKPIDAWNLSFDADFTIDDIWNANIISENNGVYEISCSQSTMSIMPDSTVVIGIRGSKNADLRTSFKTVKLTETIIDESTETIPEYPIDENNEGVFCKNITSEDDIEYTSNDFSFIKNQLLLMADDNITYQEMSDIVRELNAEIVGYIDISNEYQIEFNSNTNIDYLNSVMNQLLQNSSIESVSLNYYYTLQPNFMPNDEKMSTASGINNDNWNLYAINAFRAWDYYDDMSEVKIGLIDSSFDENHEDLDFKKTWKNPLKDTIKSQDELSIYLKHGTHVAGIMAAGFNNNNGITGVCPKNELYGYVFVEINYSAELHHLIKQTDGVLKILGAPSPLPEYESEIMRWLFNDGEIIEQSNALIDDNGNCIGYEGFLSGQDDKVTYLNKRQCKASVAVKFGGRVHKANLGIELKAAPKADDNTGQG